MGRIIVFEGVDASGKKTQSKLLYDNLKSKYGKVCFLDFPVYEDDSSALVRMYLNGELGKRPDDVNAYAASTFFAVDRYASFKKSWEKLYEDGYIFICNRYTTSNAVHQCAKLDKAQWDGFIQWLFDFEYNKLKLPKPDIVYYLDMPLEVTQRLLNKRYKNDENKKDIHEKDADFLLRSKECANYLCEKYSWVKINCAKDNELLPIETIQVQIVNTLERLL